MEIPNVVAPHIGRKIERIRELKGVKQDTLASKIGVSQQTISRIEQSAEVDEDKLKQIAEALGVSVETIRHFNEEAVFNNFVYEHGTVFNYIGQYQFNPMEKIIELYERLLESERKKNELLETKLKDEGK